MASIPDVHIPKLVIMWLFHGLLAVSIVMADMMIYFEENEVSHTVLKGENISLICKPHDTSSVHINTVEEFLVQSGTPVQGLSDEFTFNCNETTCILGIMRIQTRHAGRYTCIFPETSVIVDVAYSPLLDPVCISNYKTNTFFLDSAQESYNFTCHSAEGHPPINIMLSLLYENEVKKSLMSLSEVEVSRNSQSVYLTYSTPLDASFDKVSFLCDVNQQLPTPYGNYSASCKSKTLMLPSFTVSIHPPQYEIIPNEATNVTVLCITNLPNVTLEWTDITELQYSMKQLNATALALNIYDYVAGNELLSLQCRGYYGPRTAYANITIEVAFKDQKMFALVVVLLVLILVLVFFVVFFVPCGRPLREMCSILSQCLVESLPNLCGKTSKSAVSEETVMT